MMQKWDEKVVETIEQKFFSFLAKLINKIVTGRHEWRSKVIISRYYER